MEAGRSRAETTKATSSMSQSVESVANLAQQLGSLDVGTTSVLSLPKIGSDSKIPTPNQLCRLCQTVFEGDYDRDTGDSPDAPPKSWIRHHHENDLEHSASDGCHLCNLILYALQKPKPRFQDDVARMAPKAGFGRQIGLGLQSSPSQGAIAIIAPKSESSPFANFASYIHFTHNLSIPYNQSVDSENYSKGMILQMKNWLGECKDKHEFCRNADLYKAKDSGEYRPPSRLLEVKDQNGEVLVHLIGAENLPNDTKYMTLSYRWPKESVVRLTKANEASFRQRITLLHLPRTIQDAILLVNRLGCEYLWVDALCIIQDSEADWLQESAKMCDYYSRSVLSISASTTDSDSGFLKTRNPLAEMPCRVIPKGKTRPLYVRQPSVLTDGEIDPLRKHPLNQRGWVFQERLLAPRIVHFTDVEVFWECATALSSDIYPERMWDAARKRWLAYAGATLNQTPVLENFIGGPGTFGQFVHRGSTFGPMDVNMWTELIEEYSNLDLSFEHDKLAAIGGLARKAHEVTSGKLGRYLAGLWEKCLALQLGWMTYPYFPDVFMNPRSAIYKAPSWSWASVSCRVMYSRNERFSDDNWFRLLDVHLEHALDPYGPLKTGWLRLRGSLLRVKLTRPREDNDPAHPETYPMIYYRFSNSSYRSYDSQVQMDGNPVSEIPQPEGTIVYAFPIASYHHDIFHSLHTLLLKPTGKKNGQYTRVGVLRIGMEEEMEDFIYTYRRQPNLESRLFQDYQSGPQTGALLTQEYIVELV